MFKVAPSYENATIIKIDEPSHKAYISQTCPRCNGHGIIIARVENGKPIPIPVDGGICYHCNGKGTISKWVKAYTEAEYDRYITSQIRAKERKQAKWEAEMKKLEEESEINRKEALAEIGYDIENPTIYMITGGNTYNVKEEIKERGGRYNPTLGWYYVANNEPPRGLVTIEIPFQDIYIWNARTKKFTMKDNAKDVVETAIANTVVSTSEFIGTEKERMRDLKVTLTSARAISSRYGTSIIFTFDYNGSTLVWFTSCPPDEDKAVIGKEYLLTATVKSHNLYHGIKQTVVNRCLLKDCS